MFNKLTLGQIAEWWPVLKEVILTAVSEGTAMADAKKSVEILEKLLTEELECWAFYSMEDDESVLRAIITTAIQTTQIGNVRQLLIYSATGGISSAEFRAEAVPALKKYALSKRCKRIVTYTPEESAITFMKSIGADVDTRYIYLEV